MYCGDCKLWENVLKQIYFNIRSKWEEVCVLNCCKGSGLLHILHGGTDRRQLLYLNTRWCSWTVKCVWVHHMRDHFLFLFYMFYWSCCNETMYSVCLIIYWNKKWDYSFILVTFSVHVNATENKYSLLLLLSFCIFSFSFFAVPLFSCALLSIFLIRSILPWLFFCSHPLSVSYADVFAFLRSFYSLFLPDIEV